MTSAPAALFAYGSLVDPRSAAETLGRDVAGSAVPASLEGWRRGFTQARDNRECEKTFALDADGSIPGHILGLNVHPEPGARVDGVVIELGAGELARLDLRELRYDRVDVTAGLEVDAGLPPVRVFTYVAKAANLALEPPPGAVILRSYAEAVEAAFATLGDVRLAAYLESVTPLPAPVVDAHLVSDRIPSGNPRRW